MEGNGPVPAEVKFRWRKSEGASIRWCLISKPGDAEDRVDKDTHSHVPWVQL